MHWVKATTSDGGHQYVNLDAMTAMFRTKVKDPKDIAKGKSIEDAREIEATILFHGGMAVSPDGRQVYTTSSVEETPEQLLGLPLVEPEEPKPKRALKAVKGGRK